MFFTALIFFLIFSSEPNPGGEPFPSGVVGLIIGVMLLFQLIFIASSLVAGYAVLKKKDWACVATIIASMLALMKMPFGTLVGVFRLWFFFGENWKPVYGVPTQQFGQGLPPDPRFYHDDPFRTSRHGYTEPQFREPLDWR